MLFRYVWKEFFGQGRNRTSISDFEDRRPTVERLAQYVEIFEYFSKKDWTRTNIVDVEDRHFSTLNDSRFVCPSSESNR